MSVRLDPAGWPGQAVAAGLVLVVLAVVGGAMIAPTRSWYAARGELLAQRQALLQRMRQEAAGLPALRQAAAAGGEVAGLLAGASDAVAAAALQEQLQRIAAASGLTLSTVETPPAVAAGAWHRISLRVGLNAPWPRLIAFVRAAEALPARVLIDDFHAHGDPPAGEGKVPPVQASMLIYGFRASDPKAGE